MATTWTRCAGCDKVGPHEYFFGKDRKPYCKECLPKTKVGQEVIEGLKECIKKERKSKK
jgi:hypothetical protein